MGGLSGIVYDADRNVYYSISDDHSQNNPARFYTLTIDLSDGALNDRDVDFTNVTTLLDANGVPFATNSLDPEGIALTENGSILNFRQFSCAAAYLCLVQALAWQ